MKAGIKHTLDIFDRLRSLHKAVRLRDALKLMYRSNTDQEVDVYLKNVGRHVCIRCGTSDLLCLEKVFIDAEYYSPFILSPETIVDAGANVGMATLYFAYRYPGAKIVALEPASSNFEMLRRNCGDLPNTTLIKAALWPTNSDLMITDPAAEAWMFAVADRSTGGLGEAVQGITIETILERTGANRIDLLKIDIEGAERELFSESAAKWIDRVDTIVIELHDRYKLGCAEAFYSAVAARTFAQEVKGENIFLTFQSPKFENQGATPLPRQH